MIRPLAYCGALAISLLVVTGCAALLAYAKWSELP